MSADTVAEHYNAVPQTGVGARTESRIFYMRNLNNWIKSMLINDITERLRKDEIRNPRVLDLACGKGGDLRKWKMARVDSVVMADIADVSIEQAQGRYKEMEEKERNIMFPAQFIVADCTKEDLASLITGPRPFDLVSCQFALHYSFIDEMSARIFLRNATQNLKPGGYFIGTLPDADRIVWAARQNDGEFKNSVCSVRYDNMDELNSTPPLFGAKFHFTLDSQVNCPEFLAFFPLLEHLLNELDMELLFCRKFPEAIEHYRESGRGLMGRMQALEPFPPAPDVKLMGEENEYADGERTKLELGETFYKGLGTLSQSEWEAVSMYLIFAFRKRGEKVNEETSVKRDVKEDSDEPLPKKAKDSLPTEENNSTSDNNSPLDSKTVPEPNV